MFRCSEAWADRGRLNEKYMNQTSSSSFYSSLKPVLPQLSFPNSLQILASTHFNTWVHDREQETWVNMQFLQRSGRSQSRDRKKKSRLGLWGWMPVWQDADRTRWRMGPHRLSRRVGNDADAGGPHIKAIVVKVGWHRVLEMAPPEGCGRTV